MGRQCEASCHYHALLLKAPRPLSSSQPFFPCPLPVLQDCRLHDAHHVPLISSEAAHLPGK